jgi:hypothetical protein
MKFLLILFVLAVAISPLLSMAPGKRQRKIAKLRQYAQSKGLIVTLAVPPQLPLWLVANRDTNTRQSACYTRRYAPEEKRGRSEFFCLLRHEQGWYSEDGKPASAPKVVLLDDLPMDVGAVVVDRQGCSVYWDESGGVEGIDQLIGVMELILSSLK